MSLSEIASHLFQNAAAKIRREAICLVVAAACAVGALYQGAAAAVLALEPYTGAPLSRVIVMVAFLVVGAGAIVLPRLYAQKVETRSLSTEVRESLPRHLRLAAILEALLFGFSLARKSKEGRKTSR